MSQNGFGKFAYYQFPAASEEPEKLNGELPVHYMDCKVRSSSLGNV
jgi:hypothetical protein